MMMKSFLQKKLSVKNSLSTNEKKVFKLHQNAMRKTFQLNDPLESFKMWTMRAFISRSNCSPQSLTHN